MGYIESVGDVAKEIPIKTGNFLVTGATGLIGSCLVDVLIYANENLNCRFSIYALGRNKKRILSRFNNKVIPIIQDISQPLPNDINVNYIIHAASNADPRTYVTYPVETIITNILGNKNILDYCAGHSNVKMLLTSTFEVYGEVENVDIYSEEMCGIIDFHLLRNCYPESKRCAEILLHSYCEEYGVNGIIARLSSVYGPTMLENDSKAHAQFIRNALNKENIVLKSKGLQKRTYCYVIDAVSALITILFKGKSGEVYNISNENAVVTIAEIAKTVAEISGAKVVFDVADKIEQKGFSVPQNCILDNTKLKSLGWKGKFNIREGLLETINELQQH